MGRDKASLSIGPGAPTQAARALGLLRSCCAKTYVGLRDEQELPAGAEDVPVLRDEPAAEGPLAGLLAAFREAPGAAWLVLACDLPFVHSGLLARLVARHERDPDRPFVAFAGANGGWPEPLCAIYAPAAGPILARHAARGQFSPGRIMLGEDAVLLGVSGEDAAALANVNTPEDLAAARAGAGRR